MKQLLIIITLSLVITFGLQAQINNNRVDTLGTTDAEEVTIAINPANPNIIAAANIRYSLRSCNLP